MSKYGIGQPVTRFEDPRLLRGQGRFINDVNMHGQAYAVFVRSPHAHAKIRSIDVEAAKKAPGVVAVYTGHDVKADGLGMPKANMPRKRPDGKSDVCTAAAAADHRQGALCRRSDGDGDRRYAGRGEGRCRAGRDRLRGDPVGDPDRGHGEARRARGMGRLPRQHLQPCRARQEAGDRRGDQVGGKSNQAALRDHAGACAVHGAARHARGLRSRRGSHDAIRRRAVSSPGAQHAGAERLQGAREQDAGDLGRCRRRLRHQGLAIYRASPDLVGGAQAGPAGEVDLRSLRGRDGRRTRPRQCRRDRAGAGCGQQVRGAAPGDAGQHRRLCRLRPQSSVAVRHDRHGAGRL